MNSVQQFKISSLESCATLMLGMISLIILLIEALGKVNSSSSAIFCKNCLILAKMHSANRCKFIYLQDTRVKYLENPFPLYYSFKNATQGRACQSSKITTFSTVVVVVQGPRPRYTPILPLPPLSWSSVANLLEISSAPLLLRARFSFLVSAVGSSMIHYFCC